MAARLDTFANLKAYCLDRAEELTDGTSLFDTLAEDLIFKRWREFVRRHPWISLTKDPPGAFVTTDDITTLTLTIAATGTSAAGTLSAAPSGSVSILNRKIRPSGKDWIARVTAHTGGATAITLDAVPETIAAGTACTIFQDEYDLASDLGLFIDGLWRQDGHFVELVDEETLKSRHPDPPSAGSDPADFCRLTETKIRFSHYPDAIKRYEYPYTYVPSDPSGTATLAIGSYLRPVLAEFVIADLLDQKKDKDATKKLLEAERLMEAAILYEMRQRKSQGRLSGQVEPGPYAGVLSGGRRGRW